MSTIDILQHEVETNAGHWLNDPKQRYAHIIEAVRKKHRDKWLADRKAKMAADAWVETEHPRGQPENRGEFAKTAAGGPNQSARTAAAPTSTPAPTAKQAARANAKAGGFEFASPNVGNLKLPQATRELDGPRQAFLTKIDNDVDKALGLQGQTVPVIGAWKDGAENSTMAEYADPSWSQLVVSGSIKGWLGKQKQVLIFKEGEADPSHGKQAVLASFKATGALPEINAYLEKNGLIYHTLEPISGGALVHVYADEENGIDEPIKAAVAAGKHYGSDVKTISGRGRFIGSFKDDGTDEQQRADGRSIFEREIDGAGLQGAGALFQGFRDRWGKEADEVGQTPGHGYSAEATLRGGKIYTSNVNDAVRALYEKRDVELKQPRQVSTMLEHLGKVSARLIAMGDKAPVFDLCHVSVANTNLFCAESKGIPRIKMPQIKDMKDFAAFLEKKGYKMETTTEKASFLKATQDELNGAKVAGIAQYMMAHPNEEQPRMVISDDNYIVDGHHRWAAQIGVDAANNKMGDVSMKVWRVNADILTLLKEAEAMGVGHAAV